MSMQKKYPKNKRSRIYQPECGPSLAKQSSKDECDINKIMARFAKDGVLEHLNKHQGDYGDFADATDFLESQIIVQTATEMFNAIPSHIRNRFQNNPASFLEFVQDPDNIDEMVELGIATRSPSEDLPTSTQGSGSPQDPATEPTPATDNQDGADSTST